MRRLNLTAAVLCTLSAATPLLALRDPFPLSETSWDNPEFVERFVGSYGFDMALNPRITSEESELLRTIAPMMDRNRRAAISQLQAAMTAESSAALDYTIGSLLLQEGDRQGALRQYETAIRKFPNFFRAYQNAGLAYVQGGEYAEALTFLTKALEIGGGNGALYGLIGFCYLQLERPSQALDAYRQALIFQPESNDWRLGKLNSLLAVGETQLATAMLDEMIRENPADADLWLMQANVFQRERNLQAALANLEYVDRLGASNAQSLNLLGDLYLGEGLGELAAEAYSDALATGDLSPARALQIVGNLANRGATAEANTFIGQIRTEGLEMTDAQDLELMNLEARLALETGERDRAAEILGEVVRRDPLNGTALLTLGNYYRETGDLERAEFQFEAASRVPESQVRALTALARLKVTQRNYREAVELLRRAQAIEARPFIAEYIDRLEAAIRAGA